MQNLTLASLGQMPPAFRARTVQRASLSTTTMPGLPPPPRDFSERFSKSLSPMLDMLTRDRMRAMSMAKPEEIRRLGGGLLIFSTVAKGNAEALQKKADWMDRIGATHSASQTRSLIQEQESLRRRATSAAFEVAKSYATAAKIPPLSVPVAGDMTWMKALPQFGSKAVELAGGRPMSEVRAVASNRPFPHAQILDSMMSSEIAKGTAELAAQAPLLDIVIAGKKAKEKAKEAVEAFEKFRMGLPIPRERR
jgi:hypothetical protein